ncbi:MAG: SpoIIE family protein phosphatase [Clostridia bacterium]
MSKISLELSPNKHENTLNKKEAIPWLELLSFACIGLGFSLFSAFENFSPFAVAFLAVTPINSVFAVLIAATAGFLHTYETLAATKYIGALLFVCVLKFAFKKLRFESESAITHSLVAFVSFLASSLIYLAFSEMSVLSFALVFGESVACFLCALIFNVALNSAFLDVQLDELAPAEAINLTITLAIFLLSSSGFNIHSFSPVRVVACLCLLFICNYKGLEFSCIVAAFLGLTLFVTPNFSHILPCFVLASLVCSLISSFGTVAISIAFSFSCLVVCVLTGFDTYVFITMIEVVVASVVFVLIPASSLHEVENMVQKTGLKPNDSVNREVSANLSRASQTIGEVSQIVKKVSDKLDDAIDPEVDKVFSRIQQNVCSQCMEKTNCWNKNFDDTASDILQIANGDNSTNARTRLEVYCLRKSELLNQIQLGHTDYLLSCSAKLKVKEFRNIVTDQFSAVSQFLGELATQVSNSRVVDSPKSRSLLAVLKENGIYADSLKYFTNHNSKISIEITMIDGSYEIDTEQVREILQNTLKVFLERPEIAIMELRSTITYDEKALYKVQVGQAQIASNQGKVCGDHVGRVQNINGSEVAMLSDGMGTGSRAAIDGTMAATLMEKFISCGFSFDSAISMVNSALIVKSTDESMATIDAVSINTYNGQGDFYKAGAAISFVRQDKNVFIIEQSSLALGILRKIKFAKCSLQLDFGDIILLVSDGVTTGDCGWINDELLAWSTNNMNDLATHIANLARLRCEEEITDDITVVAVKVMRN